MTRLGRLYFACGFTTCAIAMVGTGTASAQTFYVNGRSGEDSNNCTQPANGKAGSKAGPCQTIEGAIDRAFLTAPPNTIEVNPESGNASGAYEESIPLENAHSNDLTIEGEEPGVAFEVENAHPAVYASAGNTITLSNLRVKVFNGDPSAAVEDNGAHLTLDNVEVEDESGASANGVEAKKSGSLTINGGLVSMEDGASGYSVHGEKDVLTLNGVKLVDGSESEAEAGGVFSRESTLAMTNTSIYENTGFGTSTYGISIERDASASLQDVAVQQSTPAIGVVIGETPTTADGLTVEMLSSSSDAAALLNEDEAGTANTSLSHLEVDGTWIGPGVLANGGAVTLSDSHVIESPTSTVPAVIYSEGAASSGLLVQRSVLQAAAGAKPAALKVFNGNATTDSSEILGGKDAIDVESAAEATETLTVSASTVDAGAPGTASDAAGVQGVEATAKGGAKSIANVSIQGSIVLERQAASATAGALASIGCSYSAAPSQTQAAGGGAGAIACASGSSGNTEVNPLSSLFPEPLSGYQLSPSSSAVDSVPASALTLPFGLTPSATDLEGNPRVVDGNGDCVAVQDRGALELQGHSASCTPISTSPPAPIPVTLKPLTGIITGLLLSPNSFFPAPSGATISSTAKKHKRKYGTKIAYRDSQAATTTFTVLLETSGRKHGKTCQKPSSKNKHGKRCTLLKKIGTFAHTDIAGANSLHFSGRIKGKKLPPGTYELMAVAHDAAGNGKPVEKSFKIEV
jgi:hypothetical protein